MPAKEYRSAHDEHPTPGPLPAAPRNSNRIRAKWVFIAFLAISAFFLFAEHRAHLFGFLPWLILLLCPLMHIFMHGGHGHGGHGGHDHASRSGNGNGDKGK